MHKPTNREISREARRLFRLLAKPGNFLGPVSGSPGQFGISSRKTGARKAQILTTAAFLAAFSARGWISRRDENEWLLNDTGLAWLRRALAGADPFLVQHRIEATHHIENNDGHMERLCVNEGEDPLGWLHARKARDGKRLISDVQLEAGLRLRRDFTLGHFAPGITMSWQSTSQGSRRKRAHRAAGVDLSDNALAARQRFRRSLDAVGPELSGVLVDICCFLKGLEDAEKLNGWPQRSGKLVLQMALSALARHYGLLKEHAGSRRTKISHWGVHDYRPEIDGGSAHDSTALRASS